MIGGALLPNIARGTSICTTTGMATGAGEGNNKTAVTTTTAPAVTTTTTTTIPEPAENRLGLTALGKKVVVAHDANASRKTRREGSGASESSNCLQRRRDYFKRQPLSRPFAGFFFYPFSLIAR